MGREVKRQEEKGEGGEGGGRGGGRRRKRGGGGWGKFTTHHELSVLVRRATSWVEPTWGFVNKCCPLHEGIGNSPPRA